MTEIDDRAMKPTMLERLAALTAVAALVIAIVILVVFALENLGNIVVASVGLAIAVVGGGTCSRTEEPCVWWRSCWLWRGSGS